MLVSTVRPLVLALACAVLMAQAVTAAAQVQSPQQQTCVNSMNKAGQKVAATQGKDNTSCIKDDGNGKLTGMTADDCLTADRKAKVAGAETKTVDTEAAKCAAAPSYGKTNATTVNTAAKGEELSLVFDVFGPTLDTVILTDPDGKGCQAAVSKTYEKFVATYLKEYNGCKKTNMKAGTIMNEAGMEACLGQDPKSKISKASQKMLDGLDKKCVGVTLGTAFPGECAAAVGNTAFRDCVQAASICHACLAVNEMDAISRGCDTLDNGALDSTCRECGNGTTEAPEGCDDAGESATCDTDCTVADCGDGNVNATAGETCDDADASDTDPCPTTCVIATCGDGFICSEAGCTTGPSAGVEQCDNAGANSDVTPDACRTNCANPSCGDGVIDTGEDCDDSGESATCNADCTTSVCGDGVENTTAGEECDDANLNNNDSCLNSCDDATCGDGVLCNAVGCTTGPGSGLEECDNAGLNSNVNPDACRLNCANPGCGDGVIDTGETCDDSGESTGCDSNCTIATCGDGTVNMTAGETCDAGMETGSCDLDCTARVCGDGTINVTAGEECDDGDTQSGDGCSSVCLCGVGSGEIGCQDALCPNRGELTLYAKTGRECTDNSDCVVGTCDTTLAVDRCVTDTELDTGWTGIAHDADINNELVTIGDLLCEGPFTPGPEPCGVCNVVGINPDTGDCRCSNDNRVSCDNPFAPASECGGNTCNCYFGPPLPLSSGNTPACVVNKFANDISGTANVDIGAGEITANLASVVFLGENVLTPCPSCGGTCTAPPANVGDPCAHDYSCNTNPNTPDGVCGNYDPTPDDGIRGGTCYAGEDNGASCDVGVENTSFPAPGGGGSSLDCFPSPGLNVSGTGLKINLVQTTGSVSLTSNVVCGFNAAPELCPCGVCTGDSSTTCTSNSDCDGPPDVGDCAKVGNGNPRQNQCSDSTCTPTGGGEGECAANPDLQFCGGVVRADGQGFVACNSNSDCTALGPIVGLCTLTSPKECFLPTIAATGTQDPNFPVGVAAFCIAATGNPGINTVAGLPGPGRVKNVASAMTFCASDNNVQYIPGTGGCP